MKKKPQNIELLCIGSELLSGKIKDQNFHWLAKELSYSYHTLQKSSFVVDSGSTMLQAIEKASEKADILIISGGLGPTLDDKTKPVLQKLIQAHSPQYENQAFLKIIKRQYQEKHRVYNEETGSYHLVSPEIQPIYNEKGFAPGLKIKYKNTTVFALPGVPREFQAMVKESIAPLLHSKSLRKSSLYKTFGISESHIFHKKAPLLWDQLEKYGEISCLPSVLGVDIWISFTYQSENEKQKTLSLIDETMKNSPISHYIWSQKDENIQTHVKDLLENQKLTLSTAESCTGGLISHLLTNVSGSSNIFKGSCIAYHQYAKVEILKVNPDTIKQYGVVSKETSQEMAKGALRLFQSDLAISTTGYAGKLGDEFEQGGAVHISLAHKNKVISEKFYSIHNRETNKIKFANKALHMIREYLLKISE